MGSVILSLLYTHYIIDNKKPSINDTLRYQLKLGFINEYCYYGIQILILSQVNSVILKVARVLVLNYKYFC